MSLDRIEASYGPDNWIVLVEAQALSQRGQCCRRRSVVETDPIGNHLDSPRRNPDPLCQEALVGFGHRDQPAREPSYEPIRDASPRSVRVVVPSVDLATTGT